MSMDAMEVALLGNVACDFEPYLAKLVTVPVKFTGLPNGTTVEAREAVLGRAGVMIGGWPGGTREAPAMRLVQHVGAGVEGFPIPDLPRTAYLCNAYGHESSVAEAVWLMSLALTRNFLPLDAGLRRGRWAGVAPHGDLIGLTMGVIGFGRIGATLVAGAQAFGVRLIGIRGSRREATAGVDFLGGPEDLGRVLEESDIVVVSCPLNDSTRGLIGAAELARMKPTAFLLNVARGPVVQEEALYNAVKGGVIAGAGIDVWYEYPADLADTCLPSRFPFQELENVLFSPHVSGWSVETRRNRMKVIARNIDHVARGEEPENVVHAPAPVPEWRRL